MHHINIILYLEHSISTGIGIGTLVSCPDRKELTFIDEILKKKKK